MRQIFFALALLSTPTQAQEPDGSRLINDALNAVARALDIPRDKLSFFSQTGEGNVVCGWAGPKNAHSGTRFVFVRGEPIRFFRADSSKVDEELYRQYCSR